MKRRKSRALWKENKRKKSFCKLDKETSRPLMSSIKNSSKESKKSKREEFNLKIKRRDMRRIWRSSLNCTTKKWKKYLNQVLYKKKKRKRNTIKGKKRQSREREKLNNSKEFRPKRRKERNKKRKKKESTFVRTMKSKSSLTSTIWWKDLERKNKTWTEYKNKETTECLRSITMISLRWQTSVKTWRELWKFSSMKGRN